MGNSRSPALPDACDILEGNFMVKVLCKGGPYYWIKKVQRSRASGMAVGSRAVGEEGPRVPPGARRCRRAKGACASRAARAFRAAMARDCSAAPPRRPTRTERNRFRRQYRQKYFLLDSEIYPRDATDPPDPLEHALNNLTSITFYGGSPHRPARK